MDVMFDRVAGLDVGKDSVTVCVRVPGVRRGRHTETRTFKTTTACSGDVPGCRTFGSE